MFTRDQLIKLLAPLIVEQILTVLVGMADVVMVAAVGETAVSGVSAQPLISKMREYFEVDPTVSDEEGRALVGVLYEMLLRTKDVSTSEYVFASDVDISFITKVKEAGPDRVKSGTPTART